jgi:hypothetical protein
MARSSRFGPAAIPTDGGSLSSGSAYRFSRNAISAVVFSLSTFMPCPFSVPGANTRLISVPELFGQQYQLRVFAMRARAHFKGAATCQHLRSALLCLELN